VLIQSTFFIRFFQRSASTLCAGYPPPDPFQTPLCNALPLADQPQLLQPNARREDMFGMSSHNFVSEAKHQHSLYMLPTRLSLAQRTTDATPRLGVSEGDTSVPLRVELHCYKEMETKIYCVFLEIFRTDFQLQNTIFPIYSMHPFKGFL